MSHMTAAAYAWQGQWLIGVKLTTPRLLKKPPHLQDQELPFLFESGLQKYLNRNFQKRVLRGFSYI
jgi:hypothetical protein